MTKYQVSFKSLILTGPSQKWNTYGKMPPSGPGSTVSAAKNFIKGLEMIVTLIKETLQKDKISVLGKQGQHDTFSKRIYFDRFHMW